MNLQVVIAMVGVVVFVIVFIALMFQFATHADPSDQ